MDFRLGRELRLRRRGARSPPQLVEALADVPLPRGTLLNVNCPGRRAAAGSRSRGSASGSTTTSCKLVDEDGDGRRRYRIYGVEPASRTRTGTDLAAVARGRDRGHPAALRPHRRTAASTRLARLGPRRGCSRRPRRRSARERRRRPGGARARSCAASSPSHDHRYYVLDDPGSATTTTTRCSTSCARSRRSTRSCARPTRRPSGSAASRSSASSRSRHLEPMLSLGNARNEEELRAWETRMRNHLERARHRGPASSATSTEPKIDGLAISLIYEDGVLRPRRDPRRRRDRRGRHPQPAHDQARSRCGSTTRRELIEVRGEVYLPLAGFARAQRAARRGRASRPSRTRATPPPARSASSTPSSPPTRPLSIWCYGIGAPRGARPRDATARRSSGCASAASRSTATIERPRRRSTRSSSAASGGRSAASALDFEIDGVVVKVDDRGAAARARRRRARAALGDRLEVPADDGDDDAATRSSGTSAAPATCSRSRCSSRSTSAASRSAPRRSTTRRTSRARTSARATRWSSCAPAT